MPSEGLKGLTTVSWEAAEGLGPKASWQGSLGTEKAKGALGPLGNAQAMCTNQVS